MELATRAINAASTFDKTMDYFSLNFFGNYTEGEEFIDLLDEYLDNTKFPADKMIIDPYYGYNNQFGITFKYNDNKVAWYKFEMQDKNTKIIKISSTLYTDQTIKQMFEHIITDFIDDYNQSVLDNHLKICNIHTINDIIDVIIDDYENYKPNGTQVTLNGTFENIFEQYTAHNDMLKYCNGEFWKFNNKDIAKLYAIFKQYYKGNYFLANEVKRGCLID